ncbi:MAG: S-adenosylmethionine:tRNA ribosyltransferase-isomerase, partial [Ghiorsea sp.]|nr:S-adenosylmethionine:tRNA ribosyltransferase-isomerase [Ghiorsea sp.]
VDNTDDHIMHEEAYIISQQAADTINQAKQAGKRIVAVGTTSLRTLEAASQSGTLQVGSGRTDIFITPSYQFKMTDALLTNFHLPKSTLLMLVSALAGQENIKQAYQHAIQHQYRFYSYGDAMFMPKQPIC